MKFKAVTLQNFGCFYGKTEVDFSLSRDRKVTIIYGDNGGGKSTLLNAINWCLTGKLTPGYINRNIVSAISRKKSNLVDTWVELWFVDEDDREFLARRDYISEEEPTGELKLFESQKDGNIKPLLQPRETLQYFFPDQLVSWLIFDAEAIDQNLNLTGSPEFKKNVRNFMGFNLTDILIEDLGQIKENLDGLVAKQGKNKSMEGKIETKNKKKKDLENCKALIEKHKNEEKRLREKLDGFEEDLFKNRPDEFRRQMKKAKEAIKKWEVEKEYRTKDLLELYGDSFFAVMSKERLEKMPDFTGDDSGQIIPSPYHEKLLKDLLEKKECICKRAFEVDSKEYQVLKELIEKAPNSNYSKKMITFNSFVEGQIQLAGEFEDRKEKLEEARVRLDNNIRDEKEKIKEVEEQLERIDEEEWNRLKEERDRTNRDLSSAQISLRKAYEDHSECEDEIKGLNLQIARAKEKITISEDIKEKFQICDLLLSELEANSKKTESSVISLIQSELEKLLDNYSTSTLNVAFNKDNYGIKIKREAFGREETGSSGETQLIQFCFVATLIRLASKKEELKDKANIEWLSKSINAPLVLDAPYGKLDPTNEENIAKVLSDKTSQLIILVNGKAANDELLMTLDPYTGKRFILVEEKEHGKGNRPEKVLVLKNNSHSLVRYESEIERSVIEEIN